MKKQTAIVLAISLAFLTACWNKDKKESETTTGVSGATTLAVDNQNGAADLL